MRGSVLRILAASLSPLLQRLSVSDSSAHVSPHQPRKPASARPQRRRHDLDPVERWQPGNEADLTSVQAGRGPPYPFRFNVVRDNSFAPLNNINGGLVKP